MEWSNLYLTGDGRLVDFHGNQIYNGIPKFKTVREAENWLEQEDERANCVGLFSDLTASDKSIFAKNTSYQQ